ncbi:hypothetical protein J6590_089200 [Homalodisca vitripennis]|nr:hypothetical protein J6590_089200 [Homalodisca vitripennis]
MADEQEQERIRQILNESFASSVEDVVIDNSDNDEEDIVEEFMEQTDTEQEGEYSEEDMEEDHQHEHHQQPRFPCYIVKDRITRWRIHCHPARSVRTRQSNIVIHLPGVKPYAKNAKTPKKMSLQKNLPTEIRQRRQEVAGTSAQVEKADDFPPGTRKRCYFCKSDSKTKYSCKYCRKFICLRHAEHSCSLDGKLQCKCNNPAPLLTLQTRATRLQG